MVYFPGRIRPPNLSVAPSSPAVGELYYDTGSNILYYWNGTVWMPAGSQIGGLREVAMGQSAVSGTPTGVTTTGNGDALGYTFGTVTVRAERHYAELNIYVNHNNAGVQNLEIRLHEGPAGTPGNLVGVWQMWVPGGGIITPYLVRIPFTPAAGSREYHWRWRSVTAPSPTWQILGAIDVSIWRLIESASTPPAAAPAVPVGAVIAWPNATPPTNYALCNGAVLVGSSYPALSAVIAPVGGNITLPDLRDRFVVGAGSTYALAATGGLATVTLTSAQCGIPAHTHVASSAAETTDHTHPLASSAARAVDQAAVRADLTTYYQANHTSPYYITATTGRSAAHTHTITVNNSTAVDAGSSHENRPPYYALYYIIRVV
jgi:microcystin-dependent protein